MGVQHCMYPWHWMTLSSEGSAHPCHHGSHSVGNICNSSIAAVWNGPVIQEVRASILAGKVHEVCRTTNCPHQQPNDAFSPPEAKPFLDRELAKSFDDVVSRKSSGRKGSSHQTGIRIGTRTFCEVRPSGRPFLPSYIQEYTKRGGYLSARHRRFCWSRIDVLF